MKDDLPKEEEFKNWSEMLDELVQALRSVGRAEGNITRSEYINAMRLYDDQSFRIPLGNLKGQLAITRSYLLDLRNRVNDIRGSCQTARGVG